ncbi:hypothetical protein DRW48_15250 [Paracoccus suum]|uniref:Sulfotransferase domain-containing protein n=1 Tax=Paracoccus suum TaxID=2259340 RepID=A0A344PN97_9RHOB|nr:hypothetical protein [Paracoccus suum]AXC50852.1 hypothetical protein DRW48_15250 [Paracoccus suum]
MLYLHIGTQKTGSSTIQHFLRSNDSVLREKGFRFVRAVRGWIDHNKVARELRSNSVDTPRFDAVVAELREASEPNAILSAEEFFHKRAARRMGEHLPREIIENSRVIVYLRRPDDLIEALYKQRLKTAAIEPRPMRYLRDSAFEIDYLTVLTAFEEVFGRERITVRPYRRDLLINRDIIDDFLHVLGLDDLAALPREMPEDNPTFSAAVSDLMGDYVRHGGVNSARLNQVLAAQDMPMIRRSGDVYNAPQRRELLEQGAEAFDTICKRYGEHLRPVFAMPDFDAMGDKGYPTWRQWSDLHQAAGRAMMKAIGEIQKKS